MSAVVDPSQIGSRTSCPYCYKQLAHKSSVDRHIREGSCKVKDPLATRKNLLKYKRDQETRISDQQISTINQQSLIDSLKDSLKDTMKEVVKETLKDMRGDLSLVPRTPMMVNNNQNLNILCLGKNDNLLDMLSSTEGLENALTYMKDCVLAQLAGDCRILERAYKLNTEQAAIMYANKSKTKYRYYDERRRLTTEGNASVMAKKIAGILQRSYLKGMEGFKTDLLGETRQGETEERTPELEAYDIHLWNEHVQRLADEKYQKKVLKSLKIPMAPPD